MPVITPTTNPLDDLQAYADSAIVKRNIPAMSVAIWKDGVLTQAAAGCLNINTGVEATTDSIFQIGSITKVMTSCLVMQLVDEGRVNLDKPVVHYLRDFMIADAKATQAITVRQLLNHTNGIAGDYFPDDEGHQGNLIARFVDRCSSLPLMHPVGEMWSYSNAAFCVAGRLVEVLRGMSWYAAMQEYLFKPLGMAHAIADPKEMIRFRTAMGHVYDGDNTDRWVLPERAFLSLGQAPVGSTPAMSAENLIRFARAHLEAGANQQGQSWLSPESVKQMQQSQMALPKTSLISDKHTGLGWGMSSYHAGGIKTIGHGGGTNGFLSMLQVIPEQNAAIAILTNGVRPSAIGGLTADLLTAVTGIEMQEPEPDTTVAFTELAKIAGVYECLDTHIKVTATEGRLLAHIVYKLDPLPPLELELRHVEALCPDEPLSFAAYNNKGERCLAIVFLKPDNAGVPQYLFNGGRLNRRMNESI
ncbi:D-alanyl-D-alanine carboxypeptidase precursor [Gammaproteobacteria bacterium MOLA455]|nr:D-alanyl-D-alanine carboxypeptidase precursor [Gammaproteobacteria bacterium MOLA455]